jgi:hypothetical protein
VAEADAAVVEDHFQGDAAVASVAPRVGSPGTGDAGGACSGAGVPTVVVVVQEVAPWRR